MVFTIPLDKSDWQEGFHARCVTASMIFRGNVFKRNLRVNTFHVPEIQWSCEREFSCCARSRRFMHTIVATEISVDTLAPAAHQSPYHEIMGNESGGIHFTHHGTTLSRERLSRK